MGYRCDDCGHLTGKWMGFCPQCRAGSTLREVTEGAAAAPARPLTAAVPERRSSVGIAEIDRVLGGGVVPGSVMLLGGEPGVGKSTLLLQWAAAAARAAQVPALVVSAEESPHQVAARAGRIGAIDDLVLVSSESSVAAVAAEAERLRPSLLVIDSIQTMEVEGGGSVGGPGQVREAAARLAAVAKRSNVATVLIGHVTKDGSIAGPKLVEHMVDVVMYLEGDADHGIRFLRTVKNRFGATNEVGVFEMGEAGMAMVPDPSSVLVADRGESAVGSVLFPTVDGRRAMLVEVQALTVAGRESRVPPQRSARGIPIARLHQVLAVLSRHAGIDLAAHDVYLSVMGGVRISEPAADLPVAAAVASAVCGIALPRIAAWGEVGLTGVLRSAPRANSRAGEAERFGVTQTVAPGQSVTTIGDALRAMGLVTGRDRHLDLVR